MLALPLRSIRDNLDHPCCLNRLGEPDKNRAGLRVTNRSMVHSFQPGAVIVPWQFAGRIERTGLSLVALADWPRCGQ